jgi:hypothetical protein
MALPASSRATKGFGLGLPLCVAAPDAQIFNAVDPLGDFALPAIVSLQVAEFCERGMKGGGFRRGVHNGIKIT